MKMAMLIKTVAVTSLIASGWTLRAAAADEGVTTPTAVRFKENPIIRPEMLPGEDGANICDPSLMRAPEWLKKPLGKYYLYFADHKGAYIRLAYADRVQGPWKIYEPGTLKLDQVVAVAKAAAGNRAAEIKGGHISSPDVLVDNEKKEIRMYFHFQIAPSDLWGHKSLVAVSKDGIHFDVVGNKPICGPYIRVFQRDGYYYAVDRSAAVLRSRDGLKDFEAGNPSFAEAVGHKVLGAATQPAAAPKATGKKKQQDGEEEVPGQIRHTTLLLDGNVMSVYLSRAGDLPESIMLAKADLSGDWKTWRLSAPVPVLAPEMDYEGGNVPPKAPTNPEMRKLPRPMFRELRDPYVFRDEGITYLLYSVAGERGIAGAILQGPETRPASQPILPKAGDKFIPADVDAAHPVYENSFDDPSALKDWKLEGGKRMSVSDGNLVLESDPAKAKDHLVCWLTKEVPGDFLLEFTLRPKDRHNGLNIVFFNARGINGESIFDPSLKPRTGEYPQYNRGDINCYHVSYWAGGRESSNMRKSFGFHLVVEGGLDLIHSAPADAFQTVRIYKRGGAIRVMVDDVVEIAYDDDGKTFGPVYTHSGWIGLRQMAKTERCEYGYVKVYPLKP